MIVHKSCKECAPVCTKVTSYTALFLPERICFPSGLETLWRKKENTHSLPRPSVCMWGLQGCQKDWCEQQSKHCAWI